MNKSMRQSLGGQPITRIIPMILKNGSWTENHSLPYLLQTFKDHRSYFPSNKTGLNDVEYLSLTFIRDDVCLFSELFNCISKKRINDGLSDLHFAAILKELMIGEQPLLTCDIPLPNYLMPVPNSRLELTSYGLDVLNGKQNRFNLVGIDWWVGGVHLRTHIDFT